MNKASYVQALPLASKFRLILLLNWVIQKLKHLRYDRMLPGKFVIVSGTFLELFERRLKFVSRIFLVRICLENPSSVK